MRHIVGDQTPHKRLDLYLTELLPELSRAQVQRSIKEGHIQVGGICARSSQRVVAGQELTIEIPPPKPSELKAEPIPLSILYEDRYLLVVDKPAGLVVHPAPGHLGGTLVNALLGHGGPYSGVGGFLKPGIVHRLDKETSGILVVAKDDASHRGIAKQFAERSVGRTYLALVRGVIQRDEGTIDAPIGRHPARRMDMSVRLEGRGREAITRFRVMKRFPRATFVALFPQTGRTHQLRVHLAHIGHPILGDLRYGVAMVGLSRQALHAHKLSFIHPKTGKPVHFESSFPDDLEAFIKILASQKKG